MIFCNFSVLNFIYILECINTLVHSDMKIERQEQFMKKMTAMAAVMMSAALTACTPGGTAVSGTETKTTVEAAAAAGETASKESKTEETAPQASTTGKPGAEVPAEAGAETSASDQAADETYEDNFAVGTGAAKAFAEKIKTAVADGDMEALADLTSFPVYVGIAEGGVVETREDFLALGAEKVLTAGLVSSIEGADISNLSPSMAGFSISEDGKANIIFGVVDGSLAISGINY